MIINDDRLKGVPENSETIEDIVSDKPGLLVKWGNVIFLVILILIVATAAIVRYPDVIKAEAKLTSINSPKNVPTKVHGKLAKLFVREGDNVSKDDIIALIESPTDYTEVLQLELEMRNIQDGILNENWTEVREELERKYTHLGELQSGYQVLVQSALTYYDYTPGGFYYKKMQIATQEKQNLLAQLANLKDQKKLLEEDVALTQQTFDANEKLMKDSVLSVFDFRLEKSRLLSKKMALPQLNSTIAVNLSQQMQKDRELMELENSINQQKTLFQQAVQTFHSQVLAWKHNYVVSAPISGSIAFASFVEENQYLDTDQTVCYITPEDLKYYAEIVVPQSKLGKVAINQNVLLKFPSYPYEEYGSVVGSLTFISHIPSENGYLAKVSFPSGLTTTFGKEIQFRDGLEANAEIITKDLTLLTRMYHNLVRQIKD